jgi:hypothetical protein
LCIIFQGKNPSLASAVEYSRKFYLLQSVPTEDTDKGGYLYNLIIDRIRDGVYPAAFLPMYRWVRVQTF